MKKILLFLVLFFGLLPMFENNKVCLLGLNTATAQIFGDSEIYESDKNIPSDVFADIIDSYSQMGMGVQIDNANKSVVISEYISGVGTFFAQYQDNGNGTWSLNSISLPLGYTPPQPSGGTTESGATGTGYASGYGGSGVSDWDEYYWWPSIVSTGSNSSGNPIYYADDNPWLSQMNDLVFPTPSSSSSGGGAYGGGGGGGGGGNTVGSTFSGKFIPIYETNFSVYDPYEQAFSMTIGNEFAERSQLSADQQAVYQNSSLRFWDIFNCFINNPSFVEDLQKGNFDNYNGYAALPLNPLDRSSDLMERTANEASILRDLHSDWSDAWTYGTAFWNVIKGTSAQQTIRAPTPADRTKIHNIINDYGSILGIIPGVGHYLDKSVNSTGSNFGYNAFWRLAHNIKPNSYVGGLGVIGEGIAMYEQYSDLNLFNQNGSGSIIPAAHSFGQTGTQDFTLLYTQNSGQVVISQAAQTIEGNSKSRFITLNQGERLKLLYEVKTYSQNTDAKWLQRSIINGFYQAIKNAVANPSSANTRVISILYISRNAYLKAYNDNPDLFKYLYVQLAEYGGSLMLSNDLFSDSKVALDSILKDIKDQTQN